MSVVVPEVAPHQENAQSPGTVFLPILSLSLPPPSFVYEDVEDTDFFLPIWVRNGDSFEVLLLHAAPIIVVVHGLVGTMYAHAKLDGSSVGAYFRSAAFAVVAPVLFVHVVDLLITATPSCLLCILSTTILTNLLSIAIGKLLLPLSSSSSSSSSYPMY